MLKNKLSAYLHRVEAGKGFFVTDRGQPIAALVPLEQVQPVERDELLVSLARNGQVLLPTTRRRVARLPAIQVKGLRASDVIAGDRR